MTTEKHTENTARRERIAEMRRERGWTQEAMAIKAGMSLSTYQKLESGENSILGARVSTIMAVADALGVTIDDLLGRPSPDGSDAD